MGFGQKNTKCRTFWWINLHNNTMRIERRKWRKSGNTWGNFVLIFFFRVKASDSRCWHTEQMLCLSNNCPSSCIVTRPSSCVKVYYDALCVKVAFGKPFKKFCCTFSSSFSSKSQRLLLMMGKTVNKDVFTAKYLHVWGQMYFTWWFVEYLVLCCMLQRGQSVIV